MRLISVNEWKNCFKENIFCPMMTMTRWRSTSTINWWRVYNSFLFKRSSCLLIFSNILVWLSGFFCFYFCIKEKQFAKEMKSNLPFLSLKKKQNKNKKKTKRQKRTIERKNERKNEAKIKSKLQGKLYVLGWLMSNVLSTRMPKQLKKTKTAKERKN